MDNKSFKGKNINPEGVIDSFTLLKYESHLLTRRVCILSAKALTKNDSGNLYPIAFSNRSISLNVI